MKCIFIITLVTVTCFADTVSDTKQNIARRSPCDDRQHLFLTPGVLAGGSSNRACISRLGNSVIGTAHLVLTLEHNGNTLIRASRDLSPGNGGCIDIMVPRINRTEVDLRVTMSYPASRCVWERRLTVRVLGSRVMYVQTERPRYRPGDVVRLRILQLRTDLTPSNASIDSLWIESPGGVRVMTWSSLRPNLGVSQARYTLDEQAATGAWKAHVRADDGSMGSAEFSVGEYEPSPFQLSVRHSPRVLRTSDRLIWTVCIRYPWGEAVEGMLVIRLRGASSGGVRTALRVRAPRACHRHAVAARRVGLNGSQRPDVIVADFSFQEGGTMVWQNTTVISQVIDQPITLEFINKHRSVIAPRLPHKLKVKAIRWDDYPATNVTINICCQSTNVSIPINVEIYQTTEPQLCHAVTTDAKGIAHFSFTASEKETFQYLRFKASLHNDSSVSTEMTLTVLRNRASHAAFGPLVQDALLPATRAPVPLYLNLPSTEHPITVHFAVITRGGVIYRWGTITQCPAPANSKLQTYGGRCYGTFIQNQNRSAHEFGDRTENILRVMLPIRLSSQMCPDSDLIAYFYYGGELISANKHFEVDECFVNKVEARWSSRQVLPGSPVSLHITTPGPAICAVSAMDINSAAILKTKDILLRNLKRILGANRNLTAHDTLAECFSVADPELFSPSNWLGAETQAAFAESGVRVVTDLLPNRIMCAPAALVNKEEKSEPRSYFPEAWLWRVIPINDNGSGMISTLAPEAITRYEASLYCVARNGLGVATPTVLQVFREFFIHTDAPKHMKLGDVIFLQYRIFNYIYNQLPVRIEITTDVGLRVIGDATSSACLNARSSTSRRVGLRAEIVGAWSLRVTARTINDRSLCANTTYDAASQNISDKVELRISVKHEGIPTEEHRSSLLCANYDNGAPRNMSVKWSDRPAVPRTEVWTVTAHSELIGPLLTNADSLISLPRGCGEQNMARLATNVLALEQLRAGSTDTAIMKDNVARGFARQLQFAHPSGGFSAFGVNDGTPSTWLTAFTLRYLLRAHNVLARTTPIPAAVSKARAWLLRQQMENGCFRNEGQVFHRELKGGLNEEGELANVGLTAYVVTSLLEGGVAVTTNTLRDSLSCFRALPLLTKTHSMTKNVHVYSQVLVAYALMKLRKYEDDLRATNDVSYIKHGEKIGPGLKTDEEVKELVGLFMLATREHNLVWWDTGSLPSSIEATGYALLALSLCPSGLYENCASDARAAAAWLANHRSSNGGFISTQDTLVALEGMSAWFRRELWPRGQLLVTASSGTTEEKGQLMRDVPLTLKVSPRGVLNVNVQGTGCALIQASRIYNSLLPDIDPSPKNLKVQVSVQTEGPFDCTDSDMCFCAAVVTACAVWSNAFPAMALLEIWLPAAYRADSSKLYSQLEQKDTLLRRIETRAHNGRVVFYLGTKDGRSTPLVGHECFSLHAVGPKRRMRPAHAQIIDYYKPDVNDTQTYTISEECPARISHDSRSDFTNNLYGRALIDDDDNETFEDLPDDIPLDDPARQNITVASDGITHQKEEKSINLPSFEKPQRTDRILLEKSNEIPHQKTENETTKISFHDSKAENKHKEKIREIDRAQNDGNNEDSNTDSVWSNFHVINSETDLEVPPGIEGPVPSVVLPPRRSGDPNSKVAADASIPKMMTQRYATIDHYTNYPVVLVPAH